MTDKEFTRRLLQTVFTVAAVAILIAVLWEAREALMLIYVSALIAMGFAPLVQIIGRPRPDSPLARHSRHLHGHRRGAAARRARRRPAARGAGGGALGEDARRVRQVSAVSYPLQTDAGAHQPRRS